MNVVGIELKTRDSSSVRSLLYRHKRRLCIKSTSSFHQSSRPLAPALGSVRTEKPDDLYVPFEESLLGNKPTPLTARSLAATDNPLPWSAANIPQRPTQPKDPTRHGSGTHMADNCKSFEPDIQLRNGLYSGDGDQPTFSHALPGSNDIVPGGLGRRIHTARSRSDQDNQGGGVILVESQSTDPVVDVLLRLPSIDTGVRSARVPRSQARGEQKAGGPLSSNDSFKKPHPSKQARHLKTEEPRNGASRKPEPWQVQKHALQQKFGQQGWSPRKRLSPDALEGIRALHAQYPEKFTTPVLADQFKVSPEAIRRILRSKWRPDEVEEISRRQRWDKRGESIWRQMVELGVKPPKRWREMGVTKTNNEHGSDPSTKFHHGRGMGNWNATKRPKDHGAEQSPRLGTVSQLGPEELLEERIL